MPVSRLFVEVGKGVDRMNESLRQAITTAQASGAEFGKITASGQAFIAKMQDALNPTAKFREQLDLLQAAGMKQGEVWKVMGEQLIRAAEDSRKMGQAIDPTVQKMLEFGKTIDKSGFSVENLGKTITDFVRNPVEGAKTAITGFLGTLGPTAVGLGGIATALGAAGVAVFKFVDNLASSMERLQNLSAMTGITTQSLEAFEQIAKNAGLESLDLGRTIGILNKNLGDSDPNEFTKAMKEMGISITDAAGHTKDAITILDEMRDSLLGVEDPTMRAQLAQQVLGDRLRELIPLLLNSSKSLKDARDEMEQFGITTDDLTKQRLAALDGAIDRSSTRIAGWWHQFELAILNSRTIATILSGLAGEMDELTEAEKKQREEAAKRLYIARAEAELNAHAKEKTKELIEQHKAATEAEDKWVKECEKAVQSTVTVSAATGSLAEATDRAKASIMSLDQIDAQFLENLKQENSPYSSIIANIYELEAAANRGQEALSKLPVLDRGVIDPDLELQLRKVPKLFEETAQESKTAWDRQISTIGTDLSKSIADGIMSGKIKILDTIRDIGSALLRALIETLVDPFMKSFSSLLNDLFSKIDWGSILPTSVGARGGFASLGILPAVGGGVAGAAGLGGLLGGGVGGNVAGGIGGFLGAGAGITALTGGSMSAWMAALGVAAPYLAAAIGAAYGIPKLINAFQGKNAYEAGSPEAQRDFGVKISTSQVKDWYGSLGLSESQAYGVRKDLFASPAGLQMLGQVAQQQGTYDEFLKRISAVTTAWGTFDFRAAFELGQATGDWSELNQQFVDAFEHSNALKATMPDFAEKLKAAGEAGKTAIEEQVELWKAFREAISQSITPVQNMYDKFLETGEITEQFRKTITDLGGDISRFEGLSGLVQLNNHFAEMVQHFRDTGEILPELRDMFGKFGGDLKALDDALALPGLRTGLAGINDLISGLEGLQAPFNPIQQVLSGQWGAETWGGLAGLGLDPSKLTGITDIIRQKTGWDKAISDFQKSGKITSGGVLEHALIQFGGSSGIKALENLKSGFNTITPDLLEKTKAAMDQAYQTAIKDALAYLGTVQKETSDKITTLTKAVEDQFTIVGKGITESIDSAKTDVVDVLNQILIAIAGTVTPVTTTPATPAPSPGGGGGEEEPGRELNRNRSVGGATFQFQNCTFGPNLTENDVERMFGNVWDRGGFAYAR